MQHLQQQLKRAQNRMKRQADKHRTDREFAVGDSVFLKLQPFVQTSMAQRPHQKQAFRYYGPYPIIARVGAVAYKLKLPEVSKIHPVVHVSQLKKLVGPEIPVSSNLPPANTILQAEHTPACILGHKMVKMQGASQPRILVQWSDLPSSLATWEDLSDLQRRFPVAPAWGQVGSQEGVNVTTDMVDPMCMEEKDSTVPVGGGL